MTPYFSDDNQITFIYIFTHLFYFSSVTFPKSQVQQVSEVFVIRLLHRERDFHTGDSEGCSEQRNFVRGSSLNQCSLNR